MGFPEAEWQTPLSHLSGGQKTRVLLGRLLLEEPDLLILDEPTNHLDMPAVEWLERTLRNWAGALIVVSHDRYFLDAVVNRVWDLEDGTLTAYKGDYSSFVKQRQATWEREMALFAAEKERHGKRIGLHPQASRRGQARYRQGQAEAPDARYRAAWKKLGVSGREGKSWLEIGGRVRTFSANEAARRLRDLKPPRSGPPPLAIRLQAGTAFGAQCCQGARPADRLSRERRCLRHRGIQVDRQDCVALIGPNGSGKSTMLKTLMGELPASAGRR